MSDINLHKGRWTTLPHDDYFYLTSPNWSHTTADLLKAIKRLEWVLFFQVIGLHLKWVLKCFNPLAHDFYVQLFYCYASSDAMEAQQCGHDKQEMYREYLMNAYIPPTFLSVTLNGGQRFSVPSQTLLRRVNLILRLSQSEIHNVCTFSLASNPDHTATQTVLSSCSFLQTDKLFLQQNVSFSSLKFNM